MFQTTLGVFSLLLILGAANAGMQTASGDSPPRLQISRLSGKLEVSFEKRIDETASRTLPFLHSGSIVRVRSGSAVFDSDYHVTVRAGAGAAFQFAAVRPVGNRSGELRIAVVDKAAKPLEISVGDRKFRLKHGGAITIVNLWPGEMSVRSEGGGVLFAPGSMTKDGSVLASARRMDSGDAVAVVVPETADFENIAISSSHLRVSRAGPETFVVEAARHGEPSTRVREADARHVISDWPVMTQRTAEAVMEKYGAPDLSISDRLSWYDKDPWKITTVYRNPQEHLDVLEQTIAYKVPQDKMSSLARLDFALRLSRDNKELSATSESEETNTLALNLADEVVKEKKSPEDARRFYLKTVVQWNAGKSSPYMSGLLFR